MKTVFKIVLPLIVIAGAAVGAIAMIRAKPTVETKRPENLAPLVRVQAVKLGDHLFVVKSQGTVMPRTESQLVPEVSGRVVSVAPSFESGGFFEFGEILLKIEDRDYRQAVIRAWAEVVMRKVRVAQETAEADVARQEWEELGEGDANPLTLRILQLEEAGALLKGAEAALEQSEYDLERTEVKAPFAGRVRRKMVDMGQFVSRGTPMAVLYAVDFAEIRLPLPDDDLAFLDLPLRYRGGGEERPGPPVLLRADFAGKVHTWEGRIVRTEGEIDTKSRMVHVVARVKDPYGRGEDPDRPPLSVGLYVEAEIQGRRVEGVAMLPRQALRGMGRVWVVSRSGRLQFRDVELLRTTRESILVKEGLEEGELVCLSPMEAVTDGMEVRIFGMEQSGKEGGEGGEKPVVSGGTDS